MSPPTVLVNTFLQPTARPFIDLITKVYIFSELLLGVNRLPVITEKWCYTIPAAIYSFVVSCGTLYLFIVNSKTLLLNVFTNINIVLYVFCVIFGFLFCKRLHRFYYELNNFDNEIGCKPKFVRGSIKNLMQGCVVIGYILILFFLPYQLNFFTKLLVYIAPAHIMQTIELHYYAHLLNLLLPRLRLINHYMCISLTQNKNREKSIFSELILFINYTEIKEVEMKKIMDLYCIIVRSYNYLIEGIKWQLLFIIISSFISVLGLCYHFSLILIQSSGQHILNHLISDSSLTFILIIPLFAPCVTGDRIHNEVRRLRQLLASRLYENKLDKSSRSIARTLLAFTETRNLSFILLRMLNIDISLPFKFVGLLATYLIILLQFQKVLNP